MKNAEREVAIKLRREGKTYAEILRKVPVAKSTLSLWLHSVALAEPQHQRITKKRREAQARGALVRKRDRLEEQFKFLQSGIADVGKLTERELWLVGVALYWAEGSKQHEHCPSTGIAFGNSDPGMLRFFLAWLRAQGITDTELVYELYLHSSRTAQIENAKQWWTQSLDLPPGSVERVYVKRGNPRTKRHNRGDLYHGLLRIKVRSSTALNRRISGWSQGLVASVGNGVIGNTSAFGAEESRFEP